MTTDLRAHLDRLDTALAAATPGAWHKGALSYVYTDSPGSPVVADEVGTDDAALIVAAVNALPRLLAAVRAAADLADHWDTAGDARFAYNRIAKGTAARALRDALAGGDAR